jgi:SAM-dependent methyltransferase
LPASPPLTLEEAARKAHTYTLTLPSPEEDGRIQTLNEKGAESPFFDQATREFMGFAAGKKVLEVGGAYGRVMREVLKNHPDTVYHLNDLDPRHLWIAARMAVSAGLAHKALENARFRQGNIATLKPTDLYDGILVARVLHFFSPSQMKAAPVNLFAMLKPGGRIYVVAITPYVKRYKAFIPEYERRVARGHPYPGYVTSLKTWLDEKSTTPQQARSISKEPFMFLDSDRLGLFFKEAGFRVLTCQMVDLGYTSPSWSLDHRENVILTAEKPA